jgi:hypothetical protein
MPKKMLAIQLAISTGFMVGEGDARLMVCL